MSDRKRTLRRLLVGDLTPRRILGSLVFLYVALGGIAYLFGERLIFRPLSRLGASVLGYDYPGYGRSGGSPSERGANRAIEGAYRHLTEDLGFAPRRVVLYGQSVGSDPTLHLAASRPVGGVVLHAAFVSAFRVLTRWPLFPFDRFANLDRVREIEAPLLILHGTADEVVAPWHGRRLFEVAASKDKRIEWFVGAGHNDLIRVGGPQWRSALRGFLQGLAP